MLVLLAVLLALTTAGVQRGRCYCNVGVCYRRNAGGEIIICRTDEDFFGKSAHRELSENQELSHWSTPSVQPQATSLFGVPLYPIKFDKLQQQSNELLLTIAKQELQTATCSDPAHNVWIGRRQAYAWNYTQAVDTYSRAIKKHADYAPLYRHRGHRHITRRNFSLAEFDLANAVKLMDKDKNEWEADGQPNAHNIPLSTLQFNSYYHLGLSRYLQGDYQGALAAYNACYNFSHINDESLQATAYWRYMTMRRLGISAAEANKSLCDIRPGMRTLDGSGYLNLTLMFQGRRTPQEVMGSNPSPLDLVTVGYGVGNWYAINGMQSKAANTFKKITNTSYWAGFGFIAAEADLFRWGGGVPVEG